MKNKASKILFFLTEKNFNSEDATKFYKEKSYA